MEDIKPLIDRGPSIGDSAIKGVKLYIKNRLAIARKCATSEIEEEIVDNIILYYGQEADVSFLRPICENIQKNFKGFVRWYNYVYIRKK